MNEELFDVVDQADNVVGQKPRSHVHREGLAHRAVHVLIFDRAGRIFLQKRSMRKDTWPGAWDSSASGHLGVGESYDDCAVREVHEELGCTLPCALEKLFKIAACEETGQEFVWVYRCVFEGPFQLNEEEIDEGEWFTASDLDRRLAENPGDFASGFVLIWKRLKELRLSPK